MLQSASFKCLNNVGMYLASYCSGTYIKVVMYYYILATCLKFCSDSWVCRDFVNILTVRILLSLLLLFLISITTTSTAISTAATITTDTTTPTMMRVSSLELFESKRINIYQPAS